MCVRAHTHMYTHVWHVCVLMQRTYHKVEKNSKIKAFKIDDANLIFLLTEKSPTPSGTHQMCLMEYR